MRADPEEHALHGLLQDWGLMGLAEISIECWLRYRNDSVLPYAGGWLDQPEWVRSDFKTLDAVEAWHLIQNEKPDPPSRSFFDIFKRGR